MASTQIQGLFIEIEGDGEPVVCIHGLGGSSNNWTPVMAALAGQGGFSTSLAETLHRRLRRYDRIGTARDEGGEGGRGSALDGNDRRPAPRREASGTGEEPRPLRPAPGAPRCGPRPDQ